MYQSFNKKVTGLRLATALFQEAGSGFCKPGQISVNFVPEIRMILLLILWPFRIHQGSGYILLLSGPS